MAMAPHSRSPPTKSSSSSSRPRSAALTGDTSTVDDETRPLLHDDAGPSPAPADAPTRYRLGLSFESYVVLLVYLIAFCITFGDHVQPAPRFQVYEDIVCREYYEQLKQHVGGGGARDCKADGIQDEVALLRGVERFLHLIPAVLAIPYGMLADRYGRPAVLCLAIFGALLSEVWSLLICLLSDSVQIRWIWAQFVFELIGGGPSVVSTMLYLMIADVVPAHRRTNVFFRVYSASGVSSMIAPAIASVIMDRNVWAAWILGEASVALGMLLALMVPNTAPRYEATSPLVAKDANGGYGSVVASWLRRGDGRTWPQLLRSGYGRAASAGRFTVANYQVVLLLTMAFLEQLGSFSIITILLLYISKRFELSFSKAGYFLSVNAVSQLVTLIIILPLASNFLMTSLRQPPAIKDRNLILASSLILFIGAFVLGLAPSIPVAVIGTVAMSLATGLHALVRSLLTSKIAPGAVSVVYAAMTMLGVVGSCVAGPLYAAAFSAGLHYRPGGGGGLAGLPFLVAGVVAGLAVFVLCALVGGDVWDVDEGRLVPYKQRTGAAGGDGGGGGESGVGAGGVRGAAVAGAGEADGR